MQDIFLVHVFVFLHKTNAQQVLVRAPGAHSDSVLSLVLWFHELQEKGTVKRRLPRS